MHIDVEYKLLRSSINYFIGMAENAISYVNHTFNQIKPSQINLVISHKRIKKEDFNNPLNLIVDHRSRDIAEYLKYLFFNNCYDYVEIKKLFEKLSLDQFSYQLIYARLLFPTYYFDLYDNIINRNTSEEEILTIIKRVEEYEDYLENIYTIINNFKQIEKVNWL